MPGSRIWHGRNACYCSTSMPPHPINKAAAVHSSSTRMAAISPRQDMRRSPRTPCQSWSNISVSTKQSSRSGKLRVGLIGSGKMGRHHLKAIGASGCAIVVGVADPAATEEDLRPWLPAEAIITADAAELIARARPDVVHIVTPPATHAALAAQAIRKGCHVYIEKTFVDTRTEAERLFAL